ncbi:tyrosine-protein phosphatase [Aquicoccus sp. SU-CL01552]|uniref:tyrosine-protein phosphatase n=1 Tax=Aquicoccus sp. SU-CL01552 TaxID=3127656 RepID=UPI003104E38E
MKDSFQRRVDLPGVQNIRDLGGYPTGCGRTTRWRRVLRGDGLHRLTPDGFDALSASGLTSVMDLRSEAELANDPNPFMNHARVTFYHKPVYDDLAPALMATQEAGEDDPLIQFYLSALIDRGEAIRDILSTIATAPEGTLLFHCTAGKDRTGLVAALLLEVAGVDRETILADYSLTGDFIHDLVEELLDQTRANGGDAEMHARFLSCAPLTMSATLDQVTQRHGSISNYLKDIGLEAGDISALRDRLLGD